MHARFASVRRRAVRRYAAQALALLACVTAPAAAQSTKPSALDFAVPLGAAPVIDGKFAPDEWRDAKSPPCAPDGPTVLLMHDDSFLYIAVRDPAGERVTSVFLDDGKRVRVLHASQALGTAEYERAGQVWKAARQFQWEFRASGDEAADAAARRAFEEADRWFASTATMGEGETEFAISLTLLRGKSDRKTPRLAVAAYPKGVVTPPGLTDGCSDRPLIMGETPAELRFDSSAWLRLNSATNWSKGP